MSVMHLAFAESGGLFYAQKIQDTRSEAPMAGGDVALYEKGNRYHNLLRTRHIEKTPVRAP